MLLIQDGASCIPIVRALATFSGAIAGLLMILVGSMLPSALLVPIIATPPKVLIISSNWQIPALLLCALVSGPRAGVIASVAYITIGLFYLPIFHGGGGISYLTQPGFGYLVGFVPAAWISGQLSKQARMNNFLFLTVSALAGLIILHIFGITRLSIGSLFNLWQEKFSELFFSYSLSPLTSQLSLCPAIGVIAFSMRRILLVK